MLLTDKWPTVYTQYYKEFYAHSMSDAIGTSTFEFNLTFNVPEYLLYFLTR